MAALTRRTLLLGAAAAPLVAFSRAEAAEVVLSNARILVGDGTELRGGVRIRDGKFAEVGASVTGGVDLGGGVLHPGWYDGGSSLGLSEVGLEGDTHDEAEGSDAITPQASVIDGYNALSEVIPVQRTAGVLGALVLPSPASLVSGQAAWMRTITSPDVRDAVLVAPAGLVFSLGHGATGGLPNGPKSRMGVAMKLRDLFDANAPPPEPKKKKGEGGPTPTAFQAALHAVRRRETKAIFCADRADDLLTALELTRAYELDAVILGAAEGHLVAAQIAAAKVPLLLGPVTVQPDSFQHLHAVYENAALLHAAGVRFGLRQGDDHQLRNLPTEAGIACAYGLPFGAAVAAATGNGPGFWGLPVGQIKVGFVASCVWTDGDPLQPRTVVRGVWMDGASVPTEDRQTRLFRRFR